MVDGEMGKVSGFLFVLPYVLILSTYESRDRFLNCVFFISIFQREQAGRQETKQRL